MKQSPISQCDSTFLPKKNFLDQTSKLKQNWMLKETYDNELIATMKLLNSLEKDRFFYYMDAPTQLTETAGKPFSFLLSSDNFEKISASYFRLIPGVSASKAITDIIYGNQAHILDCTATMLLAQYNAMRLTIGDDAFDHLFGREKYDSLEATPKERRLIIGKHLEIEGSLNLKSTDISIAAVNPLSWFFDFHEMAKERVNLGIQQLQLGDRLWIQGHREYSKKHLFGVSGGLNLICVGNDEFIGFGLGDNQLSCKDIIKLLTTHYNQSPNKYTQSSPFHDSKLDLIQCKEQDIVGFRHDSVVVVDMLKIKKAINSTDSTAKQLSLYLQEAQESLVERQCRACREQIANPQDKLLEKLNDDLKQYPGKIQSRLV